MSNRNCKPLSGQVMVKIMFNNLRCFWAIMIHMIMKIIIIKWKLHQAPKNNDQDYLSLQAFSQVVAQRVLYKAEHTNLELKAGQVSQDK